MEEKNCHAERSEASQDRANIGIVRCAQNRRKASSQNDIAFIFAMSKAKGLRPPARNHRVAEGTVGVLDVVFSDVVTVPVDEQLFTIVAIGVVSLMTGNIAQVYVVDTLRKGNLVELF
jgi:hypothetical protein